MSLISQHHFISMFKSEIDFVHISLTLISEWGLETSRRVDVNQVRFSVLFIYVF